MSDEIAGRGCGKPLEVCTVMGEWAQRGIEGGWLRSVSRENILQIKREAESQGLVTWIMNVESARGQVSCSCCGCCCKALAPLIKHDKPAVIAKSNYYAVLDEESCTNCEDCLDRWDLVIDDTDDGH